MSRRTVWEGGGVKIILDEKPGGAVTILRATDYDSGPAQAVEIPAEAVALVGSQLTGEGEFAAVLAGMDRPGGGK